MKRTYGHDMSAASAGHPECAFLKRSRRLGRLPSSQSVLQAAAQTFAHLDLICHRLSGLRVGKKLRATLNAIGPEGRQRLTREGVDSGDAIRGALILIYGIPPAERDEMVSVCVQYGKEAARLRLAEISEKLRDPALRLALGISVVWLRRSARDAGVSPAALSKRVSRIRAKIIGKG